MLLFKSLAYSISDSLIVLKCLGRIYTVLKYITSPHDYVHLYNHHLKQETECFFPLENFLSAPSSQFPPTPDKGKHCSNLYHRLLVLSVPELCINNLGSTLFFLVFPSTHYFVFETLLFISVFHSSLLLSIIPFSMIITQFIHSFPVDELLG